MTVKRSVENHEYGQMVRRMIRAYGRRVADADDVDLAELVELRSVVESAIASAVQGQREQHARSWADVARGLGTSRQGAQKRYGDSSMTA